jgi:hypothetical protein
MSAENTTQVVADEDLNAEKNMDLEKSAARWGLHKCTDQHGSAIPVVD